MEGAAITCSCAASWPQADGFKGRHQTQCGQQNTPCRARTPSPAAKSSRETQGPGIREEPLTVVTLGWKDVELWWSKSPGFGPGNQAPSSPLALRSSLSLSLCLSAHVCGVTGWGPVGWFGLEEMSSKDPNSLHALGNCFPGLRVLNWNESWGWPWRGGEWIGRPLEGLSSSKKITRSSRQR